MTNVSEEKARSAEALFRKHGGTLRTSKALELGIHPRTLYHLRDEGRLEQLSRGVYRLAALPALSDPDFVTVAMRVPEAIMCLISALAFHDITTEIPHEVHVALPRGKRTPSFDYPPLRVYRFSKEAYTDGIETHQIDDVAVRVYSAPKTVADCIKFRNQIGQDVAIEALKLTLQRQKARPAELMKYARVCRVEARMTTYLEALL